MNQKKIDPKSEKEVIMDFSFTQTKEEQELLKKHSKDINCISSNENQLDPIFDRKYEIHNVWQGFYLVKKNNSVLVEKLGIGKTAIVKDLARKIIEGKVLENLNNKKNFGLDVTSILAGTQYRGSFEKKGNHKKN